MVHTADRRAGSTTGSGNPHPYVPSTDADREAMLAADSSLSALASYFPETGFALGMGPWPSARTSQLLATLGVSRPAVDQRLIDTYVASLRERGLVATAAS